MNSLPDVVSYPDPVAFVTHVAAPMAADAIANNVFLIIADQMAADPEPGQLRVGVFEAGACVLAGWMTPPYRFGLADLGAGEAAAVALAQRLWSDGVRLPGLVGPKRLVDAFAAAWGGRLAPGQSGEQNFYRIEHVTSPAPVPGKMRLAATHERELLCDWMIQMGEDSNLPAGDLARPLIEARADRALASDCAFFWEADGRPAAFALERPFRAEGSRVTTVFTARDQRGRGYGAAITAALSQRILDSGRWCVLFADADNPHTNRIYQRLGYRFQAVYSDIHFVHD